jgi:hypothetical protein
VRLRRNWTSLQHVSAVVNRFLPPLPPLLLPDPNMYNAVTCAFSATEAIAATTAADAGTADAIKAAATVDQRTGTVSTGPLAPPPVSRAFSSDPDRIVCQKNVAKRVITVVDMTIASRAIWPNQNNFPSV